MFVERVSYLFTDNGTNSIGSSTGNLEKVKFPKIPENSRKEISSVRSAFSNDSCAFVFLYALRPLTDEWTDILFSLGKHQKDHSLYRKNTARNITFMIAVV